jgi:hypothetical protein
LAYKGKPDGIRSDSDWFLLETGEWKRTSRVVQTVLPSHPMSALILMSHLLGGIIDIGYRSDVFF